MVQTRAQVKAQSQAQSHPQAYLDNHDEVLSSPQLERTKKNTVPREGKQTPKRVRISSDQEDPANPIAFWAKKGYWPSCYTFPTSEMAVRRTIARRISPVDSGVSPTNTPETPSYELSRTKKCHPYSTTLYETSLRQFGSSLRNSKLGIAPGSRLLCQYLLQTNQPLPLDSLFNDVDTFQRMCEIIRGRSETRILRDFTPLIVPSGENIAGSGVPELDCLVESLNEGWNCSLPLTNPRPQPDFSVGFSEDAFTGEQLDRLRPFVGNRTTGGRSFFMATHYMFFPFLTCEVKCGAIGLRTADYQNAHSMTLAVRGVVYLFRRVHREQELHRRIIAFSVSHDDSEVRLYGHYAEIHGRDTKYHRHKIKGLDFTNEEDRWISYRFTKTIYTDWIPQHLRRICSAINMLPIINESVLDSLPITTCLQSSESHGSPSLDATPDGISGNSGPPSSNDSSSSGQSAAKKKKRKRRRRQR